MQIITVLYFGFYHRRPSPGSGTIIMLQDTSASDGQFYMPPRKLFLS